MINLEQLKLYLKICRLHGGYLDGVQLSDLFLNYLTQLRKFTFNIETSTSNKMYDGPLPTNEAIQRSFTGKHFQQPFSAVYGGFNSDHDTCRIYSLPYDFHYFLDLNNSFSGGQFQKVRFLTMRDQNPFEDALFWLISRDMPHLEQLQISNECPQTNKPCSSAMLTFPHLERLDLKYAHAD